MAKLKIEFQPGSPRGYTADALLNGRLVEIITAQRGLRQLKAQLLDLAIAVEQNPSYEGLLVLDTPHVTSERIDEVWHSIMGVLEARIRARLRLAIRTAKGEYRGLPTTPTPQDARDLDELIERFSKKWAAYKRPAGARYDILHVLLVSWFRRKGPLAIKSICEISGYSYPTVAKALSQHESRLTRHSDRSVELRSFPREEWARFVSNSKELRESRYYTDRSRRPRPAEKLLEKLEKRGSLGLSVGGVLGSRHYVPGLDLVGTPRLDITISNVSVLSTDSIARRADPALEPAEHGDPVSLAIHRGRLATTVFEQEQQDRVWADEVECLLDLHDARLEPQAQEFVENLSPSPLMP